MIGPGEYLKIPVGKTVFQYNVKNFDLNGGAGKSLYIGCSTCKGKRGILTFLSEGQIEFNTGTEFSIDLKKGHQKCLSVLTRADGSTLKQYGAYNLRQFTAGDAIVEEIDLSAAGIFYNLPRGQYPSNASEGILLDFFLTNITLSPGHNRVKVTIDETAFKVDAWKTYVIKGLKPGAHEVYLELMDSGDKLLQTAKGTFYIDADNPA